MRSRGGTTTRVGRALTPRVVGVIGATALCLAVPLGGCGDSDSSDVEASAGLPGDLVIGPVAAGDNVGWIVGAQGSTQQLWIQADDAEPRKVVDLPHLRSLDVEPIGSGLAMAGYTCESATDEVCQRPRVDVTIISQTGSTDEFATLASRDEPLDDGDGLNIVGSDEASIWLSSALGLHRLSVRGGGVESLPPADGQLCVLGGNLYSAQYSGSVEEQTTEPQEVSPSDIRDDRLAIASLTDGQWRRVPDSERPADRTRAVTIRCELDGLVMTDIATGQVVAVWTPAEAWREVRSPLPPAGISAGDRSTRYVQQSDGTVLVRGNDGEFRPSSLSLPRRAQPGMPPPALIADESSSIMVGCISTLSGNSIDVGPASSDEPVRVSATAVCDVAPK